MIPGFCRSVAMLGLSSIAACGGDAAGPKYGTPSTLFVVSGDAQVGVVGLRLSQPIVVRVTDDQGRAVPDVRLDVEPPTRGAVLATSVVSDESGLASISWVLGTIAGKDSIAVRIQSSASAPMVLHATGRPDAPAALRIVSAPTATRNGVALAPTVVLDLVDQYQNIVTTSDVPISARLSPSPNSRTLRGVATAATNGEGRASFNGLAVVGAVGIATIRFDAPGVTGVETSITIAAGPPARLEFAQLLSSNALAGGTGFPLLVRAFDESGNAAVGGGSSTDRVSFALDDGTPLGQAQIDSTGAATLAKWNVPRRLGTYSLVVSIAGATPLRHTFTVSLGAPAAITMLDLPAAAAVTSAISFSGIVVDSGGNAVPNAVVSWESASGGRFDPDVGMANGAGVVRTTFTLPSFAGTVRFRGRLGAITTNDFFVATTPGPFELIVPEEGFIYRRVGESFTTRVGTYDRWGNSVSNVQLIVRSGPGDGRITPSVATSAANGYATFSGVAASLPGQQSFYFEAAGRSGRVVVTAAGDRGRVALRSASDFTVAPGASVWCQLTVYAANGSPAWNHVVNYSLAAGAGAFVGAEGTVRSFTPTFISGLSWTDGSTGVNWQLPTTPGTYTMTATSTAPNDIGSPITFRVTVRP